MVRTSSHGLLCGLLVYAAAAAATFVLAVRHVGYGVVEVVIVAIGILGGNAFRRGLQDAAESAGAEHAAR
jgi:hypothetical protein